MRFLLPLCLLAVTLAAQDRTASRIQPARLEGQIVSELTNQPLVRAHFTLRPVEAGLNALGVDGDDHGSFILRDIAPGKYTVLVQRDGYLTSSVCLHGVLRMPPVINIASNEHITSITCRLRPSAVVSGKITFEDGEPGVNVRIVAYRQYHRKGRHGYEAARTGLTDDRGEYRLHSLPAGVYFVAASYDRPAPARGYVEEKPVTADGRELPTRGYSMTFFPNSLKLSEAVPVRLDYGKEVSGISIVLHPERLVSLRGRVTSGITGAVVPGATLSLERTDLHDGSLPVPAPFTFDRSGNFEIRNIAPGPYLLSADADEAGKRASAHLLLTVPPEDLDNIDLLVVPDLLSKGALRVAGGAEMESNGAITLELSPRIGNASSVSAPLGRQGFLCLLRPGQIYDLSIGNLPDDFYLASVQVNGTDVLASGLDASDAAAADPFEVVVDSRGGRVTGVVAGPDDQVWSGASMALIPDPPNGRMHAYRESAADEYARFQFRGVPPGKYILIAWLDDPPCDYYDPDNLDACRGAGMPITVSAAAETNLMFTARNAR
jgi:hypothetical protein